MRVYRYLHTILVILAISQLGACQPDTAGTPPPEPPPQAATPLDLSRDYLEDRNPGTEELAEEAELLPDLFAEDSKEARVRVSGSVITDEQANTLQDRLDGAEVKIEVKTK